MEAPSSPVADRRALASALRALREERGLSLDQAALEALDASGAKLSRLETGKQVPVPRDVRDLCHLYRVPARRTAELMALAASAREQGWWESYNINDDDYVGLESAATRIDQFAASYVPGLLQTPEYAEAFLGRIINPGRTRPWKDSEIQEWLAIRERRQGILEPTSGVQLAFVLDEATLLRAVGGRRMREQLTHLMTMAERPNVDLRVLPFSAGASPGQRGPFNILTLPTSADVAYLETHTGFVLTDEPADVSRFRMLFHTIREASAGETRTHELLEQAITRLT
jgi:transcriptional regulator with XRE-family HTH domain